MSKFLFWRDRVNKAWLPFDVVFCILSCIYALISGFGLSKRTNSIGVNSNGNPSNSLG